MKKLIGAISTCGALTLVVSCGGNGGNDSDGSSGGSLTGGSGSGGTAATGGASTGGAASGGSATGGTDAGGYCSPVSQTSMGPNLYPDVIENCGTPSNWTGDSGASFRDFDLTVEPAYSPSQLGPGDHYAFAVNIGPGRFAVYGATEKCGDVGELLSDVTVTENGAAGVVCHDIAPKSGTYTHLIWVWYGGGGHSTTTFCINGTCPAK